LTTGQVIAEQLLNGLLVGSIYGLVAVGLTLLYGVLHLVNFAQGEYFMLGAFATWMGLDLFGLPYSAALVVAVAASALLALLVSVAVMERLVAKSFELGVLATMGLSMLYQNSSQLLFGATFRHFGGGWPYLMSIFGVKLSVQRLVILLFTLVAFLGLEWMIRRTRIGKAMRAISQNYEACVISGIDVRRIARWTFVVGIGLAGAAGGLMGPIVVSIYPAMGTSFTTRAFTVIAIGGLGNMTGAFLGAIVLGIVESFVAGFIGLGYRDAVAFLALVIILMARPYGLFGRTVRA
jgi:branched-chain amino acid transport system permease protein